MSNGLPTTLNWAASSELDDELDTTFCQSGRIGVVRSRGRHLSADCAKAGDNDKAPTPQEQKVNALLRQTIAIILLKLDHALFKDCKNLSLAGHQLAETLTFSIV